MVIPASLPLSLGLAPDIHFIVACTGIPKLLHGLSRLLVPYAACKSSQYGERNSRPPNGDDTSSDPLQYDRGCERTASYPRQCMMQQITANLGAIAVLIIAGQIPKIQ